MRAQQLLPTLSEVRAALGADVTLDSVPGEQPGPGVGSVVKAAARDSGYRRFGGRLITDGAERPVAVSALALVFDGSDKASQTFTRVAGAAHLRTEVDGCQVAVETVTAATGLVSYWAFVHKSSAMVVLTLDTADPQRVSVADLRSLVTEVARRLDRATST